jgi:hypothetical protein
METWSPFEDKRPLGYAETMTIEQITDAMQAQPFRPFELHLADGRTFRVPHPEYIARVGQGHVVIVTSPDSEHSEFIDLLMVTTLTRILESDASDASVN